MWQLVWHLMQWTVQEQTSTEQQRLQKPAAEPLAAVLSSMLAAALLPWIVTLSLRQTTEVVGRAEVQLELAYLWLLAMALVHHREKVFAQQHC